MTNINQKLLVLSTNVAVKGCVISFAITVHFGNFFVGVFPKCVLLFVGIYMSDLTLPMLRLLSSKSQERKDF